MDPVSHPLLEVAGLSVSYQGGSEPVRAVRDFSIALHAGASMALVGESGSGKSTVALALMGLLGSAARIEGGEIRFEGAPLDFREPKSWRSIRGELIGMVFQDARGGLNPVLTVGAQLRHALRAHRRMGKAAAVAEACAILSSAGIPEPRFFMRRYPMELSGGMCQRAAIALAVCNRPRLLIADEPTSALDPSIQAQILDLLDTLRMRDGLALLMISHDLALVSEICGQVAVMYHGRVVESGPTGEVFQCPAHPYTASLLDCHPGPQHRWDNRPLATIPGLPPRGGEELPGCAFAPRCPKAIAECRQGAPPPRVAITATHWAACIRTGAGAKGAAP